MILLLLKTHNKLRFQYVEDKTRTHPEIDRSKFKGNFTFLSTSAQFFSSQYVSTSAQKQSVCIYKFAKALDCTARKP